MSKTPGQRYPQENMTLWYYASTRLCGIVKNHDFGFYRVTCS